MNLIFLQICDIMSVMKKILLSLILAFLFCCVPAVSSEIEDDYFDIAANYCVVGDYNSAMEYLDKILSINPSNKRAVDLKNGLSHVISKDNKSFIDNVSPLVRQAMEYKRIGDDTSEWNTLVKATEDSNSYIAYYYLGNFYRSKKEYKSALNAYSASSSARTDFAPAYLGTAIVLYETGQYSSAINPLDKYLSFNPEDDLAYAMKSRAEFELGMFAQAGDDNAVAIGINDCPEYRFDKAKILYRQGHYKESKELFKSLLNDIQTSKIYEYMGLCDLALKDYTSALTNFDRAILLTNDDEYLEMKYNEAKQLLESKNNEALQQTVLPY
jgi:tetratricopeptide (TPR) repeat protein